MSERDKMALQGGVLLLGAGRMGGAMARRWLEALLQPGALMICDPAPAAAVKKLAAETGAPLQSTPGDLSPGCIVLAVKPQAMDAALAGLQHTLAAKPVILSVAAGVRLESILTRLGAPDLPGARAMPNLPALAGQGVSAVWGNPALNAAGRGGVEKLLGVLGQVCWLEHQGQLDAATAISGSGPAYFFALVEALTAAGIKLGLSQETSRFLAQGTAIGSGVLLAEKGAAPAVLRGQITSPGGTTEAALKLLQPELESLMLRAVRAAAARAAELGAPSGAKD